MNWFNFTSAMLCSSCAVRRNSFVSVFKKRKLGSFGSCLQLACSQMCGWLACVQCVRKVTLWCCLRATGAVETEEKCWLAILFCYSLFQSLVLISKLPYVHLFRTMLKQIAPEYFEKSEAFLEAGSGSIMLSSYPITCNFWRNKQHCCCSILWFCLLAG